MMPRFQIPSALPAGPGTEVPCPVANLPLTGLTVLTVEDSRFASEALRLLCQRSGARLRRAETIMAARRHLETYRPDIVIVDLGLPDGDGAELIRSLCWPGAFDGLVLGSSGDPDGWSRALRAGAAGFLEKPLQRLACFQRTILDHLGATPDRSPPKVAEDTIRPDLQALQDDLSRAATLLDRLPRGAQGYVVDFVQSLARDAQDQRLEEAARAARSGARGSRTGLAEALSARLHASPGPFCESRPARYAAQT